MEEDEAGIQEVLRREEEAAARRDIEGIISCHDLNYMKMSGDHAGDLTGAISYWRSIMRATTWLTLQIMTSNFERDGNLVYVTENRQTRSQSVLSRFGLFPALVGGVSVINFQERTAWLCTLVGWRRVSSRMTGWSMKHEPPQGEAASWQRTVAWAMVAAFGVALAVACRDIFSYQRTSRSLRHKQDPAQVADKQATLGTLQKGAMPG